MRKIVGLLLVVGCGGRIAGESGSPPIVDGATPIADASSEAADAGKPPAPVDCNDLPQCLDGGCASAPPQTPIALVQKQFDVSGLAQAGNEVYWAVDNAMGFIDGCATAGCDDAPFTYAQTFNPFWVAADGPTIYWFEGPSGTIFKCAAGDACTSPAKVIAGLFNPWNTFGVGGGRVYFSVMGGPLVSCPDTGCTGGYASARVIAPVSELESVAATASTVYWRDGSGSVRSCDAASCVTPATLSSSSDVARGIATSACAVYWTSAGTSSIMTCPASGCGAGPITLASNQSIVSPGPIAVDDSGVYWATTEGIMQCDLGGCAQPRVVATSAGNATAIALDAANVYFATKGAVWKVSK
jgi:hypothetical protein